jgi:hypothetical protein
MSNTTLTLASKTALKGNPTFQELMNRELSSYGDFSKVAMQDREVRPENIEKNTKKEFKDSEVQFLSAVYKLYRTAYVTRQMVVAVNLTRNQSSCPNYLNKNDNCRTQIRGLYRLPEFAFPKDLVKEVRADMKAQALAYREEQKRLAAAKKEAEKAKAAEAKTSPKPEGEASEPSKKKTSKKAKKAPKAIEAAKPEPEATDEKPEILEPPVETEESETPEQVS